MADLAPWPTETHPLNVADAERSKARVADIELGLTGDDMDRSYWRQKLDERIHALEDDASIYGLLPHEETEFERLKALRADDRARRRAEEIEAAKSPNGGWDRDTLARWGIRWPPAKGWKEKLIEESRHEADDRRRGLHAFSPPPPNLDGSPA